MSSYDDSDSDRPRKQAYGEGSSSGDSESEDQRRMERRRQSSSESDGSVGRRKVSVKKTEAKKAPSKKKQEMNQREQKEKRKREETMRRWEQTMGRVKQAGLNQILEIFRSGAKTKLPLTQSGRNYGIDRSELRDDKRFIDISSANIKITNRERVIQLIWVLVYLQTGKYYFYDAPIPVRIKFIVIITASRKKGKGQMGFVIEIAPHTTMEEFYDVFFNQISKQVSGGDHGSGIFIGNNAKISYIHPLTGQSDNFKNRAALSYKSSLSSFLDKGLVAFHSFNRSMATDYATFKLRLHSFSCIFETYCVGISLLLNMQLNGDPDKTHIKQTSAMWPKFVYDQWNNASKAIQRICIEGNIQEFMQQCVLEELHMSSMIFCCFINLHTVDVSAYEEFMNKVDADFEMSGKGLCFFIVFEYDHVIPMIRKDVLIYFEKLRKIHQSIKRKNPFTLVSVEQKWQNRIQKKLNKIPFPPSNASELEQNKYITKTRALKIKMELIKKERFFVGLDKNQQEDMLVINKESERRKKQLSQRYAICGIDIETYIEDQDSTTLVGNFVPYLLCISGKLQRLERVLVDERYVYHIIADDVHESFWGKDCVIQFVDFIIRRGYYQSLYVQEDSSDQKDMKYGKRIRNVFFAHNGFRFDYRFLYEELYARLGFFNIVGDIGSTKSIKGKGLTFYDTALFFPFKLEILAKQFFPDNPELRKLDGSQIVTLKGSEFFDVDDQFKSDAILYCLQDAKLVKEIAYKFFSIVYSTYNGHAFLNKPFFFSSANLAWEIWHQQYLKHTINVEESCINAERSSYRGGLTCVFRSHLQAGISIDINSSYPASMMNLMPYQHCKNATTGEYIQRQSFIVEKEHQIVSYYLYFASVTYKKGELFPGIAVREQNSLITPLIVENQWLWGCELILAFQRNAFIEVTSFIKYSGQYTHKDFITDQYQQRLKAKQNKDNVLDLYHKLCMNSQYGKHGMKTHMQTHLCDIICAEKIYAKSNADFRDREIFKSKNIIIKEPAIRRIPSLRFPLYQLKQYRSDDEISFCGSTVRFASYITALSRCNIMRGIYLCEQLFGSNSIVYMDTDSIYLDLVQRDQYNFQQLFDQLYENEKNKYQIDEQDNHIIQFSHAPSLDIKTIYDKIVSHPQFSTLMTAKIQDAQNQQDQGKEMDFIHQSNLGSFKIEHYVFDCLFLGSKQYTVRTMSVDKFEVTNKVALKGVPAQDRDAQKMRELYQYAISQTQEQYQANLQFQKYNISAIFKQCGTGVHLHQQVKFIRPTFVKRRHNLVNDTSEPFVECQDFSDFILQINEAVTQKKKQILMEEDEEHAKNKTKQQQIFEDQLKSILHHSRVIQFSEESDFAVAAQYRKQGFYRTILAGQGLNCELVDYVFNYYQDKKENAKILFYKQYQWTLQALTLSKANNRLSHRDILDTALQFSIVLTIREIIKDLKFDQVDNEFLFICDQIKFRLLLFMYPEFKKKVKHTSVFFFKQQNIALTFDTLFTRVKFFTSLFCPSNQTNYQFSDLFKILFDLCKNENEQNKPVEDMKVVCNIYQEKMSEIMKFKRNQTTNKSILFCQAISSLLQRRFVNIIFLFHCFQAQQILQSRAQNKTSQKTPFTNFIQILSYLSQTFYINDSELTQILCDLCPKSVITEKNGFITSINNSKLKGDTKKFIQIVVPFFDEIMKCIGQSIEKYHYILDKGNQCVSECQNLWEQTQEQCNREFFSKYRANIEMKTFDECLLVQELFIYELLEQKDYNLESLNICNYSNQQQQSISFRDIPLIDKGIVGELSYFNSQVIYQGKIEWQQLEINDNEEEKENFQYDDFLRMNDELEQQKEDRVQMILNELHENQMEDCEFSDFSDDISYEENPFIDQVIEDNEQQMEDDE